MTGRTRPLLLLLACPWGQLACQPLIYEIASAGAPETTGDGATHGVTHDPSHATTETDDPTDSSPSDPSPSDPTQPPTGEPETTDQPPVTCGDGGWNGDETDLDCGGSCPPCKPGQRCEQPGDCGGLPCLGGFCGGCLGPEDCKPAGPCMQSVCGSEGMCESFPVQGDEPCDDGDACTVKDMCFAGKCQGIALACGPFDDPCRLGFCNPKDGKCAVEFMDGTPCDDGLACTMDDVCIDGECAAGKPPPLLLLTDFSGADGWFAEPPWQIGKAFPSKCGAQAADDPQDDHSPGPDMTLAGAAIGGCLPLDPFPQVCLTSPSIDPKGVPGDLVLRFWSVLNTAPPIDTRVEVFSAQDKSWNPVMVVGDFVAEPGWTEHIVDITKFKAPGLRVRFCHAAADKSEPVGGWSLDDISLGAPDCG